MCEVPAGVVELHLPGVAAAPRPAAPLEPGGRSSPTIGGNIRHLQRSSSVILREGGAAGGAAGAATAVAGGAARAATAVANRSPPCRRQVQEVEQVVEQEKE